MADQVDVLAPVAAVCQALVGGVAVHPFIARRVVVVRQRKVRRGVTQGRAHGDPFRVQGVRHPADGGLRPLVVYVPFFKMLHGAGVHQYQWRMNHGAGVHQGPAQGIFNGFDGIAGPGQDGQGLGRIFRRPDAGGQAGGVAADGDPPGAPFSR